MGVAARLSLSGLALLSASLAAVAEPAIGQFEIKDLDNEVGRIEFQSQNAHAFGLPRRRYLEVEPGEFAYDDNAVVKQRHALEMEMTISSFHRMRVGIEYENERLDDPPSPALADTFTGLELTEVAVENVFILVPVKGHGIGFGALIEYEHPLEPGELNSVVLGTIVQAVTGPWSAILDLYLVKQFGDGEHSLEGLERDDKWDFSYAAQLMYRASESWAFALEAYGTVDRLGSSGMPNEGALVFGDHDQHLMGPLVYYTFGLDHAVPGFRAKSGTGTKAIVVANEGDGDEEAGAEVTIGAGALFGLNANTPDVTLKWSVELEF